jgi:hypothetical protein
LKIHLTNNIGASHANYRVPNAFQCIHDIRVVWPSEIQGHNTLEVILVSWGIAVFEYCFQVPANRIEYERFRHLS